MVVKQYTLKSTKGGIRLLGWKGKSIILKKNTNLKIDEDDRILDHPSITKKKNMIVTKSKKDVIADILGE